MEPVCNLRNDSPMRPKRPHVPRGFSSNERKRSTVSTCGTWGHASRVPSPSAHSHAARLRSSYGVSQRASPTNAWLACFCRFASESRFLRWVMPCPARTTFLSQVGSRPGCTRSPTHAVCVGFPLIAAGFTTYNSQTGAASRRSPPIHGLSVAQPWLLLRKGRQQVVDSRHPWREPGRCARQGSQNPPRRANKA